MRKYKVEIAKTMVVILIITMLSGSGVMSLALRNFTITPLTVPLQGSVPTNVYFNAAEKFNDTWITMGDFYTGGGHVRNPVLFAADDDDMEVWRAVYNGGGRQLLQTDNYIFTFVNGLVHHSQDAKTWYQAEYPDGYTFVSLIGGDRVGDRYAMFSAQHGSELGVLATENFEDWMFIEDFPEIPEGHRMNQWDLMYGGNGDWYIYSQFENTGRQAGDDAYGVTFFYRSTGVPASSGDWSKIGEYDGIAYIYAFSGANGIIIDQNFPPSDYSDGIMMSRPSTEGGSRRVHQSADGDWNNWPVISGQDVSVEFVRRTGGYDVGVQVHGILPYVAPSVSLDNGATSFTPTIYWGDEVVYPPDPSGAQITSLELTPTAVGVKVDWEPADFTGGYRVFRDGVSINDSPVFSGNFLDLRVSSNSSYSYAVEPFVRENTQLAPGTVTERTTTAEVSVPENASGYIIMQIDNVMMNANGMEMEIDPGRGTVPTLLSGRTMVPIRAVVEAMGGYVDWDATDRRITLYANRNNVIMQLDSLDIQVNGQPARVDVAPTTINDRTMLPIRFVIENVGCVIEWIGSTMEIVIVY